MFEKVLSCITEEASGERAYAGVVSISRYHRIQASPGFRMAADYCADVMLESSENASTIHYPAESGAKFWHFPSFEEWRCKRGVLKITAPQDLAGRIADFGACPISLIQRSAETPRDGVSADIIYAGSGRDPRDYKNGRGKIAIVDSYAPHVVYDAAVKAGVRGIIIYRQRPLGNVRAGTGLRGIRPYCSFWWDEKDLFGFVLTPEDGERLVSYLTSPAAKERPLKAWAFVDSEKYPGTLEVVTSSISGREQKEILLIAHLCHPQPSAGDNASGAAVVLEVHRFLNELIARGELPKPRYGIRFLLVPEITGTFAFLSQEHELAGNLILGLNLDMVGQKQDVTGSTLCVEKPPMSNPSFGPYLLADLSRDLFSITANPGDTAALPFIRWIGTPFSGGSDHAVLSDPAVGVPTPMLIQWPDKYYHTSGDRPENVSPDLLGKIAAIAGTYVYLCALADESALARIASIAGRGLRKEVIETLGAFPGTPAARYISPRYKAQVLASSGRQALRSLGRLAPGSRRLRSVIAKEESALRDSLRREAAMITTRRAGKAGGRDGLSRKQAAEARLMKKLDRIVVRRVLPGPVDPRSLLRQLPRTRRARLVKWLDERKGALMIGTLGLYWADGKRSIAEIARLVAAELGDTDPGFLKYYFGLLEDAGIVELD